MISDLSKSIEYSFMDYFAEKQVEPIYPRVWATEDVVEDYFQLRPDRKVDASGIRVLGMAVQPKELDGEFTILLDSSLFMREGPFGILPWMPSCVHELAHVLDMQAYAKMVGQDYDEVLKDPAFHLWTEYHASKDGEHYITQHMHEQMIEDGNDVKSIPRIAMKELLRKLEIAVQTYNTDSSEEDRIIVCAMLCGVLSEWEDVLPSCFSRTMIENALDPWLLKVYDQLRQHRDIADAAGSFDQFRSLFAEMPTFLV